MCRRFIGKHREEGWAGAGGSWEGTQTGTWAWPLWFRSKKESRGPTGVSRPDGAPCSGGQQRTQRGWLNPASCIFVANTWALRFLSFQALDSKEQRCQHFLPEASVR